MSNQDKANRFIWIALALSCVIIFLTGQTIYQGMVSQNKHQARVNEEMRRHLATSSHHMKAAEGWDDGYRTAHGVDDLLTYYKTLDIGQFGLKTDPKRFRLKKAEALTFQGQQIGMIRVCFDSGGGALKVSAEDYQTALMGIKAISDRKDMEFKRITLQGGQRQAEVSLESFCMILNSVERKAA